MKKILLISFLIIGYASLQVSYADNVMEVSQPSDNIVVNAYPNPANGTINVEVNGNFSIYFYDLLGHKINVELIEKSILDAKNHHVFNIQDLPKGIYFIKAYDEVNKVQKMVKFQKL